MNPVLSIVVPVYNVESYIKACIDSILNQSFTYYELILVDDGSLDNSGRICDEYAEKDSRIKVIHQKNLGLSGARNTGIELAKGEYITFVDSDDLIQADTYQSNMELLLADKSIDLLEYPVYVNYQGNNQHIWKLKHECVEGQEKIVNFWISKQGYAHSYAWNKIYRKELFDDVRFPIGRFFEDLFTLPSIIKKTAHYCVSDKGLYYYYQRGGSITTNASYKKYQDLLTANLSVWNDLYKQSSIPKSDLVTYYLHIIDILIVLLGFEEKDRLYNDRVIDGLSRSFFSIQDLWKLDLSFQSKCKNTLLKLVGLRAHCNIINGLRSLIKRK